MPTNRPDPTVSTTIQSSITPIILTGLVAVMAASLYVWSHLDRSSTVSITTPAPSISTTASPSPTASSSPIASTTPSPTATPDPYAGWSTYSSADFGFSFRYPSEWGTVSLSHKNGDTGTIFGGQFSANSLLTFAGQTPNYSVGIGAGFLNFYGCTKNSNGTYACQFAEGKTRTITPSSIVATADGNTALVLFGIDIPQVLSATTRGAYVNLSGKNYPGIAFQYIQIPSTEEETFDRVVTSVTSL